MPALRPESGPAQFGGPRHPGGEDHRWSVHAGRHHRKPHARRRPPRARIGKMRLALGTIPGRHPGQPRLTFRCGARITLMTDAAPPVEQDADHHPEELIEKRTPSQFRTDLDRLGLEPLGQWCEGECGFHNASYIGQPSEKRKNIMTHPQTP